MKQTVAIYNIKKLTLVFLKYRRELWGAMDAMIEEKTKPRMRGDYSRDKK